MAISARKLDTSTSFIGNQMSEVDDKPKLTNVQAKAKLDAAVKNVMVPAFNGLIDDLASSVYILNDLTTGGTSQPLSAEQGKNLFTYLSTGWIPTGDTGTYVSTTSFTVSGNKTSTYKAGIKITWVQNSVTYYNYVASSTYSSSTTVNICPSSTGAAYKTSANDNNIQSGVSMTSISVSDDPAPSGFPPYMLYIPTWTGFSSAPTAAAAFWSTGGGNVYITFNGVGVSNATACTMSIPFSRTYGVYFPIMICDNTVWQGTLGAFDFTTGTTVVALYKTLASPNFTSSGQKGWNGTAQYFCR